MLINKLEQYYTQSEKRALVWNKRFDAWEVNLFKQRESAEDEAERAILEQKLNRIYDLRYKLSDLEDIAFERYKEAAGNDKTLLLRDCKEIIGMLEYSDFMQAIERHNSLGLFSFSTDYSGYYNYCKQLLYCQLTISKSVFEKEELKDFNKELQKIIDTKVKVNHRKRTKGKYDKRKIVANAGATNTFLAPSGAPINHLMRLYGQSDQIKAVFDEQGTYRGIEYIETVKSNTRYTFRDTSGKEYKYSIPNLLLGKAGIKPQRLFLFILKEMNAQGIFLYEKSENSFLIPFQKFIDLGYAKTSQSLRRDLKKNSEIIVGTNIGLNDNNNDFDYINLFTRISTTKYRGNLYIEFNNNFNWSSLYEGFAMYPDYIFSLGDKAAQLAMYMFTQARIVLESNFQTNQLTFKRNLSLIQHELGLLYTGNSSERSKVLTPIEDACKEILKAHRQMFNDNSLDITFEADQQQSAKVILQSGYLNFTLKTGTIYSYYETEHQKQIERKAQSQLRADRRERKEKTRYLEAQNKNIELKQTSPDEL